jgi:hypothetical protein
VGLFGNEVSSHQPANGVASHHHEEPFESLEEIEAKTIGNLLPDEDDLFSGMIDELGCNTHANSGDDFEDYDLFSSGGGMELEGEDHMCVGQRNPNYIRGLSNGQGGSNGSVVGEHPYGEYPSRTLFVRNINSNVEDAELKALFEVRITPFCLSVRLGLHATESQQVQLTTAFFFVSDMETFEPSIQPASIVGLL